MILLDTHTLIWSVSEDPRLGKQAQAEIENAARTSAILVSAITPWEIAMLSEKGRLSLGQETGSWLNAVLALPGIRLAPVEPAIAVDSVRLPGIFHADPADRLIIATARHFDVPLVTSDNAILAYAATGYVKTINACAYAFR